MTEPKLWEIKCILHLKFKKFSDGSKMSQDQIDWNLVLVQIGGRELGWEALAIRDYHWLSWSRWGEIIIDYLKGFLSFFTLFSHNLQTRFCLNLAENQGSASGMLVEFLQPSTEIGPMTT